MIALNGTMKTTSIALLAALLAALPLHAWAPVGPQDEDGKTEAEAGEGEDDDGEDDEDGEEEGDRYFALVGGDVYTGTGAMLRGATVLAKNGKIKGIGYDLIIPEDTEILEIRGYRVYPGLVAIDATSRISRGTFGDLEAAPESDSHFGVDDWDYGDDEELEEQDDEWESWESGAQGDENVHLESPETAAAEVEGTRSDIEDSFDPFSSYLVMALSAGITAAEQSDDAIKLRRYEIDDLLLSTKHLVSFSWSTSNPASKRSLREKLEKASKYTRKYRAWEENKKTDKDAKEPSKKGVDSNVLRVLRGEALAKFNVNNREDLLGLAQLAQQYGFRPVIQGCREGWTVAQELGRAGAYAILTPRIRGAKDERLLRPGGASIENAAILYEHGVQVAIVPGNTSIDMSGMAGRDLLHLPIEAAFAVRGGLPEEAALAGITLVPARILGCDHRVGTIEVGKDCDLIVTDGDVLHYQTFVQWTVVSGKVVYDKQEELLFSHIRPRPEVAPEPEVDEAVDVEGDEAEAEAEEDDEDDENESGEEEQDDDDENEGDEEEADEDEGNGGD